MEEFYLIQIQGFESRYSITNDGNIFSHKKKGILKPYFSGGCHYPRVSLYNGDGRQVVMVHRVVALNCIPNPNNLPEVNHKDGDKANYHPDNLEWCNASMNICHGFSTGLIPSGENHHKSKLTQDDVNYCRSVCVKSHKEFGVKPLAKRFGVSPAAIRDIINYRSWTYG